METPTLPCQDFTHNGVRNISKKAMLFFLTRRLNIAVCHCLR